MSESVPVTAPDLRIGETSARDDLARELPGLRGVPGFPAGSDERILALSLPPSYTACPNPFIRGWLQATAPVGHDNAEYEDPGPFTADISEGKSHPIYRAHSFPTKVPHAAIMRSKSSQRAARSGTRSKFSLTLVECWAERVRIAGFRTCASAPGPQ